MLLAVDIGNTNITVGLFNGRILRATWRMRTDASKAEDEYRLLINNFLMEATVPHSEIHGVVVSSVVPPLDGTFQQISEHNFQARPVFITAEKMTMMKILVDRPEEVGADRLVNAFAAYKQYGGPLIVIDFGTATTFDIISSRGAYTGGAICGGIQIVRDALYEYTAKLPRIEIAPPQHLIGKSTEESMRSGIFYGSVSQVEGMVARFKKVLGAKTRVIATGGLVDLMRKEADCIDIVNPLLTLQGLRELFDLLELPKRKKQKKRARQVHHVMVQPGRD